MRENNNHGEMPEESSKRSLSKSPEVLNEHGIRRLFPSTTIMALFVFCWCVFWDWLWV